MLIRIRPDLRIAACKVGTRERGISHQYIDGRIALAKDQLIYM